MPELKVVPQFKVGDRVRWKCDPKIVGLISEARGSYQEKG
jgi:hypothetical protein